MTWRASDELMNRVRCAAKRSGRSMNEYVTYVMNAVTDPEYGGDEAERVRERLAHAGLLAPGGAPGHRPDPEAFERARRAAGHGTPLSEIVAEDRG